MWSPYSIRYHLNSLRKNSVFLYLGLQNKWCSTSEWPLATFGNWCFYGGFFSNCPAELDYSYQNTAGPLSRYSCDLVIVSVKGPAAVKLCWVPGCYLHGMWLDKKSLDREKHQWSLWGVGCKSANWHLNATYETHSLTQQWHLKNDNSKMWLQCFSFLYGTGVPWVPEISFIQDLVLFRSIFAAGPSALTVSLANNHLRCQDSKTLSLKSCVFGLLPNAWWYSFMLVCW